MVGKIQMSIGKITDVTWVGFHPLKCGVLLVCVKTLLGAP
jgi:hypothetical protein